MEGTYRIRTQNLLTIQLQNQSKHTVCSGMLRTTQRQIVRVRVIHSPCLKSNSIPKVDWRIVHIINDDPYAQGPKLHIPVKCLN